jgi:hypothetical protein
VKASVEANPADPETEPGQPVERCRLAADRATSAPRPSSHSTKACVD